MQHPLPVDALVTIRPIFFCLPDFVRGTPIDREIFDFADEIPVARFQEKEDPRFVPIKTFQLIFCSDDKLR